MLVLEFRVVGPLLLVVVLQLGVILRQLLEVTSRDDVTVVGDHLIETSRRRRFVAPSDSETAYQYLGD